MGSTVRAATITLTVTNASPTSYALYEVKRPWSEAQATWNAAATGSSWQAGGAEGATDRGTTLLGTVQATAHGSLTVTLNAAGVAVVQKWVSTPSSNHGFVIASTTATDGIAFAAREVTTTSQRPRLDVGYDTTSGSNDGGVDASRADAAGTDAGKADAGVDSGGGPEERFRSGRSSTRAARLEHARRRSPTSSCPCSRTRTIRA